MVRIIIVDTVRLEATANPGYKDTQVIGELLAEQRIEQFPVPQQGPGSGLDAYRRLGQAERDTIRLGLSQPRTKLVLDDYLAFVVASRFGLRPLLFLDLLVLLVERYGLRRSLALDIVNGTTTRYSEPFIDHTRHKLREVRR